MLRIQEGHLNWEGLLVGFSLRMVSGDPLAPHSSSLRLEVQEAMIRDKGASPPIALLEPAPADAAALAPPLPQPPLFGSDEAFRRVYPVPPSEPEQFSDLFGGGGGGGAGKGGAQGPARPREPLLSVFTYGSTLELPPPEVNNALHVHLGAFRTELEVSGENHPRLRAASLTIHFLPALAFMRIAEQTASRSVEYAFFLSPQAAAIQPLLKLFGDALGAAPLLAASAAAAEAPPSAAAAEAASAAAAIAAATETAPTRRLRARTELHVASATVSASLPPPPEGAPDASSRPEKACVTVTGLGAAFDPGLEPRVLKLGPRGAAAARAALGAPRKQRSKHMFTT